MLRLARMIGSAVIGAMVIAIIYGVASGEFVDELEAIVAAPWGRVTLIDLGAGLLIIGAWIAWREGSAAKALPWWLAMVVTGNLASGVYVVKAAWSADSVEAFLLGRRT